MLPPDDIYGYNRGNVHWTHSQVSGPRRSCCAHWGASQGVYQHHATRVSGCPRLPSMRCPSQAPAQRADRHSAALCASTADDQPVQLHCPGKCTALFCPMHGMPCIPSDSNMCPEKAVRRSAFSISKDIDTLCCSPHAVCLTPCSAAERDSWAGSLGPAQE